MTTVDLETAPLELLHAMRAAAGVAYREKIEAAITRRSTPALPARSRVPEHLKREDDFEAEVIDELERLGFVVTKTSQKNRPKGITKGTPDLYARHVARKRRLWIECKWDRGVVSDDQKRWHQVERDAGGDVIAVWTMSDLQDELKARGFLCLS